jgi:hypothetical protein
MMVVANDRILFIRAKVLNILGARWGGQLSGCGNDAVFMGAAFMAKTILNH